MQHAVLASLLGAVACGVIGTFIVVNRLSSISGGIAHASFGGLGLAAFIGIHPAIGAFAFSIATAFGVAGVLSKDEKRSDTAIAAFWAAGMAMGLVFIKLSGEYSVDLMSYLFGSLLTVSSTDLVLMLILDLIIVIAVSVSFRVLSAVSYAPEFCITRGISVNAIRLLMLLFIAITIVLLMRISGLILIIALLTIPPAIAEMFSKSLGKMMLISTFLSAFFSLTGLAIATLTNLPAGAVIILLSALCFLIANRCHT